MAMPPTSWYQQGVSHFDQDHIDGITGYGDYKITRNLKRKAKRGLKWKGHEKTVLYKRPYVGLKYPKNPILDHAKKIFAKKTPWVWKAKPYQRMIGPPDDNEDPDPDEPKHVKPGNKRGTDIPPPGVPWKLLGTGAAMTWGASFIYNAMNAARDVANDAIHDAVVDYVIPVVAPLAPYVAPIPGYLLDRVYGYRDRVTRSGRSY